MTKRSYPTAEQVAHLWANDSLDRTAYQFRIAYSANSYYRLNNRADNPGVTVLEYVSYSTPIAYHIIHPTLPPLFLQDTHYYSGTTARQQQCVRTAVAGNLYELDRLDLDLHRSRRFVLADIGRLEEKLIKAKAKAQDYFFDRQRLASTFNEARAKLIEYGFNGIADAIILVDEDLPTVKARSAADFARRAEERKAYIQFQAKQQEKQYEADLVNHIKWLDWWRDGGVEVKPEGADRLFHSRAPIAVRRSTDGKELQTSGGARVPYLVALALFKIIHKAKTQGEVKLEHIHGEAVGSFKITSIDSKGNLTVGCHYIPYAEMERLALKLGVIESSDSRTKD